jgi:hypothetical protein
MSSLSRIRREEVVASVITVKAIPEVKAGLDFSCVSAGLSILLVSSRHAVLPKVVIGTVVVEHLWYSVPRFTTD